MLKSSIISREIIEVRVRPAVAEKKEEDGMKFFEILFGEKEFSVEEIASEIVALQNKTPEFEKDLKLAEGEMIKARQAKMCGKGTTAEFDQAIKDHETKKQDLKAAGHALTDLRIKLSQAIEKSVEKENEALTAAWENLKRSRADLNKKMLVSLAESKTYLTELVGPAMVQTPNFERIEDTTIFNNAMEEFKTRQIHPTVFEKGEEIRERQRYLATHTVDQVATEALKTATEAAGAV